MGYYGECIEKLFLGKKASLPFVTGHPQGELENQPEQARTRTTTKQSKTTTPRSSPGWKRKRIN